jgi:hypothetical protein
LLAFSSFPPGILGKNKNKTLPFFLPPLQLSLNDPPLDNIQKVPFSKKEPQEKKILLFFGLFGLFLAGAAQKKSNPLKVYFLIDKRAGLQQLLLLLQLLFLKKKKRKMRNEKNEKT